MTYGKSPLEEAYATIADCDRYMSEYQVRRFEDFVTYVNLRDTAEVQRIQDALLNNKITHVTCGNTTVRGYIIEAKPDRAFGLKIVIRPSGIQPGVRMRQDITFPLRFKEDRMKVFEALVINVDEKGEPTSIAKIVQPFLAKSIEEARTIVRVDYAQEHSLNGKDAAALQVRVREFLGAQFTLLAT